MNLIDRYSTSASDVIPDANIVILAVPMLSMADQLKSIAPFVAANTIITDAGSVKGPFIVDAKSILGSLNRVVPGHPIAGREKTGVDAADANLFRHRKVILTPTDSTDIDAIAKVDALWSQTGASVEVDGPRAARPGACSNEAICRMYWLLH